MNVVNWLAVFILSLLAISALGYGVNHFTRRNSSLWKMVSLAFAGLICATMFATLSVYSPAITAAVQAAAAQSLTCVGTPPLVRAGDEIAVSGMAPADSTITLLHGADTLATTTADASGAFAATVTLSASGLQNVSCQIEADGQTNTIALSFLVIGQAAAPPPPATNTPEPTATDTTEPTATAAPVVAPPVVDLASIPEQLLPGDTFRLRGTAEGSSRLRVAINNRVVAGAIAGPQGSWRTTIGFARSGEYTLTVQLVQEDAVVAETEPLFLTVLEPTPTPEPTATDTPEPTATNTPEPTATDTPEPTNTNTAEPTATETPTAAPPTVNTDSIPEQLLPGDTFRLRGTADGGARVRVAINDRVVAGAVAGPQGNWRTTVGFARSGEYTLTVQLVQDDTVVAESEPIFLTVLEPTPEPTATNTPEPTATNTPEPTATDTPEPTATDTPEPTATDTPEPTATNTPEPTATDTPEPTATDTPEPTATDTPEPTATDTPEPTATETPTAAPPVVDTASIPEQLLPGDTFRLRGTADGGGRVRVAINDRVVAGAVAGPQGNWRTTVGFARSGEYTLTVQLVQDDTVVAETEPIFLTVLEPTPTPEPTATNTPEPTATATNTPEPTATDTPEPTATNTPEPTATDTPEPTATPVPTPTNTPEPTATPTPEPTATNTPEPTATNTSEPTATDTPTPAAPVVDTASIPEQLLPGDTFRLRGTADGGARVRVAINDRVVAGAVAGPQGNWRTTVGFARSGEYTLTVQLVQDDVAIAESEPIFLTVLEPTPTPEPTATNTNTPEPTATDTPEPTATDTPEPTATNTPEPTATDTPEPTATNTPEPTATDTPEPTATDTNTPEPTATNTPEPTATDTPEPTATNTPEPTATDTPEPTATNTPEPTATNTVEPTAAAPVIDTASIPEQLLPGDTFRLRGTAGASVRVQVAVNGRVVAGAVAGPQGGWRTTVGFASAGTYTLTVQVLQNEVVAAETEPIFLTVLEPTPTTEPTPTAVLEPTATVAASVDSSQTMTETAPVDASQPVTNTAAPGALPGTGSDFSGGVPWVVLILLLGALVTLGMGRLSNKPTA